MLIHLLIHLPPLPQGGIDLNPSKITALSLSSAFFNYAPCLVSEDAVGAAATAVGLNIVPQACTTSLQLWLSCTQLRVAAHALCTLCKGCIV